MVRDLGRAGGSWDTAGDSGGVYGGETGELSERLSRERFYADCADVPVADSNSVRLFPIDPEITYIRDRTSEVLEKFDPVRANLPEMSRSAAEQYIRDHVAERPWLATAVDQSSEVQRVFAALDQGMGHPLVRHEGFADDEKLRRRVGMLEDPGQLDPAKRAMALDGFKSGKQQHSCGRRASGIQNPAAFALAFARAVEHPEIRNVLESPCEAKKPPPDPIAISLDDLLGPDGHEHCKGFRLAPVGGSVRAALECRNAWVDAMVRMREPDVPPPRTEAIESFEGGRVHFFFRPNRGRDAWEISTLYVEPSTKE